MKMIEVKNLSFKYNKNGKTVLDNLSFTIEKGTVNVLIGLNGSGKTTLIKTLAGLLENYSGEIVLDGKKLSEIKIQDRAKIMSYVAQRNNSVDDFLVREYLLFGRVNKLSFYSSPKKEDEDEMLKCAERFKITHLLDKKLGEISGGERQIVSICSAIIQDTDLVILDEPTSALDIKNQHTVLSIIKEIAENESCVIVGRCAESILKEHDNLLTVFIHADMEQRIDRICEHENINRDDAVSVIKRADKKRASYHNYYSDTRWGARTAYDLCINSKIGTDAVADIIVKAAQALQK